MANKKKALTLVEYYEKYKTPITTLAFRSGLSFHQVYSAYRGGTPTLRSAVALERYSEGEMTCESLLPEKLLKEMEANIAKNKEK